VPSPAKQSGGAWLATVIWVTMILKADCVLAGADLVEVSPGLVRTEGNRIAQIGRDVSTAGEKVIDFQRAAKLGQVAVIIPGLIDCHCHLELSNLAGKISSPGSLIPWLGQLVVKRPKWRWAQFRAVKRGVNISLANGTTTVADISANGLSWTPMMKMPIRKICFAEVVGMGRKRHRAMEKLTAKLQAMPPVTEMFYKGVSPHAPYSTDAEVYRQVLALARDQNLRLTTHLAEDRAEVEFLKLCTGPWPTVLKGLGLWDESIKPYGGSPVQWASEIGLLDTPAILAHVNYVDRGDIDLLASGEASVVYCPLAHEYFGHAPHSYREMLAEGVKVALGNDSLACSSELSVLAQMRAVYRAGGLPPGQVFAMGTTTAAKVLRLENLIGSIETGTLADLVVVLAAGQGTSVLEGILRAPAEPVAVMVDGKLVTAPRI